MTDLDTPMSSSAEDYLTPPKYDAIGVGMTVISAFVISVVSGVIILLASYLSIGKFSLESGASPILLAMITFFWLSAGNLLYYFLLSRIFPDIYTRGRTSISQVAIMSLVLYIFFAPVYLILTSIFPEPSIVLLAFALHVLVNTFALQLIIGIIAQYRYALLILYGSIASFLFSSIIAALAYSLLSSSSNALFLLLGLVIIAQTVGALVSHGISYAYYQSYTVTGYDPIGSIFARIEMDEKELEKEATAILTQFHK